MTSRTTWKFKFLVIFKFPVGTWLVSPAAGGGKAGLHIACDIGKVILRHPYIPMLYSMSYKTSKKFAFDIRISRYWTSISYNDIAVLTTISKKKLRYRSCQRGSFWSVLQYRIPISKLFLRYRRSKLRYRSCQRGSFWSVLHIVCRCRRFYVDIQEKTSTSKSWYRIRYRIRYRTRYLVKYCTWHISHGCCRTQGPLWLPTKLAEWIGSNLCDQLDILPKQGPLWTAAELNSIITGNLVGGPHGHLHTFGCIQWECDLFQGRPKARCYPFDIQGHRFRNKNPKVKT